MERACGSHRAPTVKGLDFVLTSGKASEGFYAGIGLISFVFLKDCPTYRMKHGLHKRFSPKLPPEQDTVSPPAGSSPLSLNPTVCQALFFALCVLCPSFLPAQFLAHPDRTNGVNCDSLSCGSPQKAGVQREQGLEREGAMGRWV